MIFRCPFQSEPPRDFPPAEYTDQYDGWSIFSDDWSLMMRQECGNISTWLAREGFLAGLFIYRLFHIEGVAEQDWHF
jgi:hypothetical protein